MHHLLRPPRRRVSAVGIYTVTTVMRTNLSSYMYTIFVLILYSQIFRLSPPPSFYVKAEAIFSKWTLSGNGTLSIPNDDLAIDYI